MIVPIITILLLFSCSNTNTTTEFIDPRDQQVYEVISIGSQDWIGADLKYETPNSFCFENDIENCQQYGRLYNFREAKTACPAGWKLPSETDWQKLEQQLGMPQDQSKAIRIWRGSQEGTSLTDTLGIKFAGMGKSKGSKFMGKDQLAYYWVDEVGPTGAQFSMYRMLSTHHEGIYSDQIPAMNLCCVRCIKE